MPEKISLLQIRRWLQLYESGKPEAAIARAAHRDVRTVKRGIELARREQDAAAARAELVKEALHKHQAGLLETLEQILTQLRVPDADSPGLPWEPSALAGMAFVAAGVRNGGLDPDKIAPDLTDRAEWGLLYEHLRGDALWKLVADWYKTLAAHLNAKMAFQRKEVVLLKEKTGYNVVEDPASVGLSAFIRVNTTGPLFFRIAIHRVLGTTGPPDPELSIVVDRNNGEVRWGSGMVLAKAPGKEEECKKKLMAALRELTESAEALQVISTYRVLNESTPRARKAAEELLLLGMVPGRCRICRRLGI